MRRWPGKIAKPPLALYVLEKVIQATVVRRRGRQADWLLAIIGRKRAWADASPSTRTIPNSH
jgi:hypothetical protein